MMRLSLEQKGALQFLADLQADPAIAKQMESVEEYEGSATIARLHIGPGQAASQLRDGPAPAVAAVIDADGTLVGELILWITHGIIDCVEQTWYGDHPPEVLPERAAVASYSDLGH